MLQVKLFVRSAVFVVEMLSACSQCYPLDNSFAVGRDLETMVVYHLLGKTGRSIVVVNGVVGFPVLFMYLSRGLAPAFKSRDLFECACNDERWQTL